MRPNRLLEVRNSSASYQNVSRENLVRSTARANAPWPRGPIKPSITVGFISGTPSYAALELNQKEIFRLKTPICRSLPPIYDKDRLSALLLSYCGHERDPLRHAPALPHAPGQRAFHPRTSRSLGRGFGRGGQGDLATKADLVRPSPSSRRNLRFPNGAENRNRRLRTEITELNPN